VLSLWCDAYLLVCFNFELCRLGTKSGEKSDVGILLKIGLLYGVYLLATLRDKSHVVLGRLFEDEVRPSVSSKVNQLEMLLVRA
jgi:hypothetical protein